MTRNESQLRHTSTSQRSGVDRFRRWCKAIAASAAVVLVLGAVQAAQADDWWGCGRSRGFGYGSSYGYGYGYGGDPYHYNSGAYNHHDGPHSGLHVGPHYHWSHGYHNGLHWQEHYDDHSSAGHYGIRPWSWH